MIKFTKFLLVLSWMTLIFTSSAIAFPDADPESQKELYDYVFDKDMHVLLFGGLSFLWCSFLCRYPLKFRAAVMWTLIFTFLYGLSDEYHQLFVPGREASAYDLLFDVIGGLGGVVLYMVWAEAKESTLLTRKHAREFHVRGGVYT